ncbi:MAG: class I SAM-dependent methyltransferase [Pseudomonadota bacterium]
MSNIAAYLNRLTKNSRHLAKWARRQNITCYRLYDRDVPEFPVTVDFYEGRVHLQEVDTGWVQSDEERDAWLSTIRVGTADVLQLPHEAISLKRRERQRGVNQYEKSGVAGEDFIVQEDGLKFIVNLDAYLDTGLFLDHRITRGMVRARAAGKRLLNLFAYTGSFTVHAAAGGAVESVTVDLSNTYQTWTQRNFELNGMALRKHLLVRADVFRYLDEATHRNEKFDLIVLDPPSFSNSKKMQGVLDVQRDHVQLIEQSLALLNPGGELFFSTNLRSFAMDDTLLAKAKVTNITTRTIPEDFRNKKIHYCFLIQRMK